MSREVCGILSYKDNNGKLIVKKYSDLSEVANELERIQEGEIKDYDITLEFKNKE